jgi:hypothetical protein
MGKMKGEMEMGFLQPSRNDLFSYFKNNFDKNYYLLFNIFKLF